ncbi:hypothetical protein LV457_01995 [Mycobacterium sp. MYCO198283]|uniref:hypothetical protein n=1 Tax=Mycobacterium sp. MYCO198283 TaxID=2883505 RepID=UPI001E4EFF73|nr:hypothetical protein [Mycobacterium sp. MYCO198283]MCG5431064.1 hypothetical protein [Mycobacterium sp. MYCO198283]
MSENSAAAGRYGSVGFAAGLLNMLVLESVGVVVLLAVWPAVVVTLGPLLLIDVAVSYLLSRCQGRAGQIGRALLISCASAPLTIALMVASFVVANAIGPL